MKPIISILLVAMLPWNGDISDAKSDYYKERGKIEREYERKLSALAKKVIKVAERGKSAELKRENVKLALEWEQWASELKDFVHADPTGEYQDIARKARALTLHGADPRAALDGSDSTGITFPDFSRKYPIAEMSLWFEKPYLIGGTRFIAPHYRGPSGWKGPWRTGRHEPFDYAIVVYRQGKCVKAVKVTGGDHVATKELEKGSHRIMVTNFFEPVFGDRVVFRCVKSYDSARMAGPTIYNFEVLAR
jgi:hypothetical protein